MLDNSEPDADIYLRLDAFNIQHVAFQTITHLDISDSYRWDGQPWSWDGLKDLSSLSHLRLNAGEGVLAADAHGLAENLPAQIQLCIFILNANCISGGDQILAPLVMGKIHEKILVGTYYRFEVSVQWHNWVLKMRPLSYPNRESLPNFLGDAFNVKRLDKYRDAEELEMRSQCGSKSVWDRGMELLQLRNKNFSRKC
ncbi:hypothetical protein DL96DRAFT_1579969 [Flagelloscypha sp. PMI_526]|nr:hypothetical protein DL96DRAFT_1579969 [Flagelloscypha sp. PMI_526]